MTAYHGFVFALYIVVLAIFIGFAFFIMRAMARGKIDLTWLLSESGNVAKASLSRFQFLLFTFVIGGVYLVLCLETGSLLDVPTGVLALLGISGGSYVISKAVTPNPTGPAPAPAPANPAPNPNPPPL